MTADQNIEVVVRGAAGLGNAIRQLREERGIDQATLAVRTDLHRTYISKFETSPPSETLGKLLRMLDALDLELVIRPRRQR